MRMNCRQTRPLWLKCSEKGENRKQARRSRHVCFSNFDGHLYRLRLPVDCRIWFSSSPIEFGFGWCCWSADLTFNGKVASKCNDFRFFLEGDGKPVESFEQNDMTHIFFLRVMQTTAWKSKSGGGNLEVGRLFRRLLYQSQDCVLV